MVKVRVEMLCYDMHNTARTTHGPHMQPTVWELLYHDDVSVAHDIYIGLRFIWQYKVLGQGGESVTR